MRLERIVTTPMVIAAALLLIAITAWWLSARGTAASEPADGGTPQPTAAAVVGTTPTPLAGRTSIPTPEVVTYQTPTPMPAPAAEPKSEPVPETEPTPIRLEPLQLPSRKSQSLRPGSNKGDVFTYKDGDRVLRVVLQDDLVVQETDANTPDDVVVVKGGDDNIVRKQARHGQDARPVFRSESGGGLMTLPGGILLVLDPEWDQTKVESFFSGNDITTDRVSDLGFLQNGFLVETKPGFASLELANALASKQGVVLSSPNWWREVEAR